MVGTNFGPYTLDQRSRLWSGKAWSTVSKAAGKSRRASSATLPLSTERMMSLCIRVKSGFGVVEMEMEREFEDKQLQHYIE